MRVLHITPWYPHADDPVRGLFIRRHIESLQGRCENHVIHIDMDGRSFPAPTNPDITVVHIRSRWASWRWREWCFYKVLKRQLRSMNASGTYTHVNFHIAYPALVHFRRLRKYLPRQICLTEHWSIYHYNFFSTRKPHRLQRLFQHGLPTICVSESLAKDIREFSGSRPSIAVVPNVVDTSIFRYMETRPGEHLLAAALWKSPKNPVPLLLAIAELRDGGKPIPMRIAGHGPLIPAMKKVVADHSLEQFVTFLGQLDSNQLAGEMRSARAFVLPSSYETFSVVTAEALCCGCPVIADNVGAIPDHVDSLNGWLRDQETWTEVLLRVDPSGMDRNRISAAALSRYSADVVGPQYHEFLQAL